MGSPCFTQGVHLEYLESFKEGCSVAGIGKGGFQLEVSKEHRRKHHGNATGHCQQANLKISRGHSWTFQGGAIGGLKGCILRS